MESEVEFPNDLESRMRRILVEDIDTRLKDLTALVALQETELALLWVVFVGTIAYVVGKDYRARQRNHRNTISS